MAGRGAERTLGSEETRRLSCAHRGFCVAPVEPSRVPEPSAEHAGPGSAEFPVGPRVGAMKPCSFASLILKSLGGCRKPGRENRHISGHLQSHLSWVAVLTCTSALGSGSVICLLPEPPGDAHPPGIFFLLYPSQNPSVTRSLNLIAAQSFSALLLGRPAWIHHPTPVTPGQQTVGARPSTGHWILDVKPHVGVSWLLFLSPSESAPGVCPNGMKLICL